MPSKNGNDGDADPWKEPVKEHPADADTCDLPESAQFRNSLVFIINNSLSYLVAPVFYVGVLHAAILESFGYSDTTANLPETVFLWLLPAPVFIAWFWPSISHLRTLLFFNYLCKALAGLAAASFLAVGSPSGLFVAILIHAAVVGITNGVTQMCLWELISRGMTSKRRGWTLGVTFGFGPLFAVLGSCASQLVLSGDFLGIIRCTPIPAPWSYVVLFGFTGPAMLVGAFSSLIACPPTSINSEQIASLKGIVEGVTQYFTTPLIVVAAIGFLLTSGGGNMILNNLGLYVREATGESPAMYAGLQLTLRFGFKSLFGFALGWMLARFTPKVPALATTLICVIGIVWALLVPGKWYLLSFGFLGAGELYYIYYLNYIVACSPPERVRENTAYTNVVAVTVSLMPLIYGKISDLYGITASLLVALGILLICTFIVTVYLPSRPQIRSSTDALSNPEASNGVPGN